MQCTLCKNAVLVKHSIIHTAHKLHYILECNGTSYIRDTFNDSFFSAQVRAKCWSLNRIVHNCLDLMTKCDVKLFFFITCTNFCRHKRNPAGKLMVYSENPFSTTVMLLIFNIQYLWLFCIVFPWSERDLTDFIIKLICLTKTLQYSFTPIFFLFFCS